MGRKETQIANVLCYFQGSISDHALTYKNNKKYTFMQTKSFYWLFLDTYLFFQSFLKMILNVFVYYALLILEFIYDIKSARAKSDCVRLEPGNWTQYNSLIRAR